MGWDPDGAVSNIYRIGVCPTVAFAYPGGIFQSAEVGDERSTRPSSSERVDELIGRVARAASPDERRRARRGAGRARAAGGVPRTVAARASWSSAGPGAVRREVRDRLRALSDRFAGAQAINLRHQSIPWAYRVFYRHIGLDPDEQPTPVEALVLERMKHGGFVSRNLLDDALTIAIVESRVALRAFDADQVEGPPGIRPSAEGEALEGRPGALPPGTLVIADAQRPLGLLFGATADGRGVGKRTRTDALVRDRGRGRARDRRRRGDLARRRDPAWVDLLPLAGGRRTVPELRNEIDTGVRAPVRAPQPRRPFGAARTESERLARTELRRQIARLERRLGELFASSFPRQGIEWRVGAVGGPRLLGTAELERVRDALVVRLSEAEGELARRGAQEEANRGLLERVDRRARSAIAG